MCDLVILLWVLTCFFIIFLLVTPTLFQFHPDWAENPLTWPFTACDKSSFIYVMAIKPQSDRADRGESEWEQGIKDRIGNEENIPTEWISFFSPLRKKPHHSQQKILRGLQLSFKWYWEKKGIRHRERGMTRLKMEEKKEKRMRGKERIGSLGKICETAPSSGLPF